MLLNADQYALAGDWGTPAQRTDAVQDDFVEHVQGRNGFPVPVWETASVSGTAPAPGLVERLRKACAELQQIADERLGVIEQLDAANHQQKQLLAELQSRPKPG